MPEAASLQRARYVRPRILSSYVSVNIDRAGSVALFVPLNRGNLGVFPVEIDRNAPPVVVGSAGRIEKCKTRRARTRARQRSSGTRGRAELPASSRRVRWREGPLGAFFREGENFRLRDFRRDAFRAWTWEFAFPPIAGRAAALKTSIRLIQGAAIGRMRGAGRFTRENAIPGFACSILTRP